MTNKKMMKNEQFFKAVDDLFKQKSEAHEFKHGTPLKKEEFYKIVGNELGLTYETTRQLLSGKPYYVPNLYNAIKLSELVQVNVQEMYAILK